MLATEPARGSPVAELLARHESALRLARSALLVDWVTDEALTLGAAQPEASACALRARSMGLPTHRRGSGGTGVYLGPGDVAWAVVLPRTDPRLRGGFCSGYASLGAGVVELLAELGTPSRWVPSRGTDPDLCFLGPRGEVLE
ncbi:MAG: hypothetical protein L3K11_08925, partial [Thermoplasmata archaeon]|nr:hypothetical protein [Thermoplasmata archaeon]